MIQIFVLVVFFFIFRPWISSGLTLFAGDWSYLYIEHIRSFLWSPEPRFFWLSPYYQILTKTAIELGLSWHLVERIFWFLPWIGIAIFGSWKFTRSWLGVLMYTTNTYALLLVGGGQMGVAMAYSLAPLVLKSFIRIPKQSFTPISQFQISNFKFLIGSGILLAVQVMFDPRIAILTFVAAVLYWVIVLRKKLTVALIWFGMPFVITVILHAYWWIPLLKNPALLGTQFQEATRQAVQYLSFATFSNTLSLLHPNWPENIFGKVSFMRPEFLVLPLLAFGILLQRKISSTAVYFVFLALVGAFLAKGTNEPFGRVYLWLFDNVPGFTLFRDATKFYLFVSLSYAYLVPRTLEAFGEAHKRWKYANLPVLVFLIFWVFTIREAVGGKLTGTFVPIPVPSEYVRLKDDLSSEPTRFLTAWYPQKSRFTFESEAHPAVVFTQLSDDIRYVIVPSDVRGEIFVTDRKYDESKYQDAILFVATMSGLRKVEEYKELAVFEKL